MRRKRREEAAAESALDEASETSPADLRAQGPWDSSEKDVSEDPDYLDFGSLLIRGRTGLNLQLPVDDDEGTIGSVVLLAEESGLELRAFANARSGGLWDDVRAELQVEAERLGGECEQVGGPFGAELHVQVPVTLPDGQVGFQPSRVVGIEGPRWMLRATFLGREAWEPGTDDLLLQALRDVVVVRGDEPRAPRDPLLLSINEDLELVEITDESQ